MIAANTLKFPATYLYRQDGQLLTEQIVILSNSRTAAMRIARARAISLGRRLYSLSNAPIP